MLTQQLQEKFQSSYTIIRQQQSYYVESITLCYSNITNDISVYVIKRAIKFALEFLYTFYSHGYALPLEYFRNSINYFPIKIIYYYCTS